MYDSELLQSLLDAYALTQAQAAEWLGMTQPGIHNVLASKSNLSSVGRKFVEHLIGDARKPESPEIAALRQIADIAAHTLPPAYLNNSYILEDVG